MTDQIIDMLKYQPYSTQGDRFTKSHINLSSASEGYIEFVNKEKLTDTKDFSKVYADDWQYSYARYYLNEVFYNQVFTAAQKEYIKATTNSNGLEHTNSLEGSCDDAHESYVYNDTVDNVFFLSYKELTDSEYGFLGAGEEDTKRQLTISDYGIAKGVYNYSGVGSYWARSRSRSNQNNKTMVHYAFSDGKIFGSDSTSYIIGFAPVMWIDISSLNLD